MGTRSSSTLQRFHKESVVKRYCNSVFSSEYDQFEIKQKNVTHWGRVTHTCVSILNTIGSENGLSPERRQAINWTNAVIVLIRPLGTNFSEILIETYPLSFKKMHSIMMFMKFSDLSQSDRSNWVMWQVKDPCPRPGWDGWLTRKKMAFIKSIKTWIIVLYIWLHQSGKINK